MRHIRHIRHIFSFFVARVPQNIFWKFSWRTTKKLNSQFHFNLTTSAHNFCLAEKYHFLRDDPERIRSG